MFVLNIIKLHANSIIIFQSPASNIQGYYNALTATVYINVELLLNYCNRIYEVVSSRNGQAGVFQKLSIA
jgi:hypothetical protein